MATLTMSGSGHAEYADGGASWTLTKAGHLDAYIWAEPERVEEYGARPWFRLTVQDVTYQGQAIEPPTMDEHGRVCFHLTLSPLSTEPK